jgi:hypothetical protein
MKKIILIALTGLIIQQATAQMVINDQSVRYQQERMVFKQWDKNKFTPTHGFLWLNPYYWLTWALHPGYPDNDLRPLGPSGPQTQRLALVGVLNSTENSYKLQADTLRNSALSEIANQSGLVAPADPLWLLYYAKELRPVTGHTPASILSPLPAVVQQKVVAEGLYDWYIKELDMLKERLDGARSTTLDRGARILAYHRMLLEYRVLAATWATRISAAATTIQMTNQQNKVKANQVTVDSWTPATDVSIARKVLADRKY